MITGPGRVPGAAEVDQDRVQRACRGDEQPVALGAAEGEVGHDLGHVQFSDPRAVRVEAVQPVRRRRPDAAAVVEADAVEVAGVAGREDLAAGERGVAAPLEDPDVLAPAVDDVEPALVRGERQPVGPVEVVGHHLHGPAARVEPVHVTGADLTVGPEALVVAVDAVTRVGEPQRAVRALDDVVGTVQPLAVPVVGEHGDGAVMLGPGHPARALLAADQPALPVDGVAVGVAGRLAEHAHRAGGLVPAQDPVVRDVAEHQVAPGREVGGALGPAAAGVQAFQPLVPAAGPEPLIEHLEPRLDRVPHRILAAVGEPSSPIIARYRAFVAASRPGSETAVAGRPCRHYSPSARARGDV